MLRVLRKALRDAFGAALMMGVAAWVFSHFAPRLNNAYQIAPALLWGLVLWLIYAYWRVGAAHKAAELFGTLDRVRELLTLKANVLHHCHEQESAILRDMNRSSADNEEKNERRLRQARKDIAKAKADFRRTAALARSHGLLPAMPTSYKEYLPPHIRRQLV